MSPAFPDEPRFYGRRHGRKLRMARAGALEADLPQYRLDPQEIKNLRKPLWLEIGFGNGEHLLEQAQANPDTDMIGCEPFMNGVSMLVRGIKSAEVNNIRIWPDDVRLILDALPDASIGRCFLLHPDPWPKTRHHKRRFIQTKMLDTLARLMTDGAELRMATDDPELGEWMLWHAWQHPAFEWTARCKADWTLRAPDWPQTRYEQKSLAEGRTPIYLKFKRKPRP